MPADGASASSHLGTRKKKSSGVYQLQISRCIMKSSHSLSLGCCCFLAITLYTIRRLCDFIVLQKAVNCCLQYFNPRPSYEERQCCQADIFNYKEISIHAPHTRSDREGRTRRPAYKNFNPRPSYEERQPTKKREREEFTIFQSTPLIRGATWNAVRDCRDAIFQSTPLIRGATRRSKGIHSPYHIFQSTPLIRGATLSVVPSVNTRELFQSTPLIRGATFRTFWTPSCSFYFNPRPSYEERPGKGLCSRNRSDFNPRPSYEERLPTLNAINSGNLPFQSTPLIRGATGSTERPSTRRSNFNPRPSYEERRQSSSRYDAVPRISIHAPHTRSDKQSA